MGFEGGLYIGKKRGAQFSTALSQDITPADLEGLSLWMDANDTTVINAKLAAQFAAGSSEWLSSSNTIFNVGDDDFSFGGWIYPTTLSATSLPSIGRWNGNTALTNRSYLLQMSAAGAIISAISSNGTSGAQATATSTVTASINNWYFCVFVYDAAANLLKVSVNGETFVTASFSGGAFSSATADFRLCRFESSAGAAMYGSCRQDCMFFYKKALSQAQVTALYNSGNGVAFENLTADQLTNLTAWWSLNEQSGNRASELGGYTLTDNNTVTFNLGKVSEPIEADEWVWSWVDKSANLYVLSQDTAASQPQWKASGFGVNSMPYISFDGTDDYLSYVVANVFSGDSSGTLFVVHTKPDITSANVSSLLSSSDSASIVRYITFENNTSEQIRLAQRNNDTTTVIDGTTTTQQANDDPMLYVFQSNGTSYTMRVNKISQTLSVSGSDNGDWFADTDDRDDLTIGSLRRSTPTYGKYNICEIIYYSAVLSSKQIRQIQQYLIDKYGTF